MAHKKAGGSVGTNRDSNSKRLGVKLYGGESAISGNIIIRQKGNHVYPGPGTDQGKDYTIFATTTGKVKFTKKSGRTLVSVNG